MGRKKKKRDKELSLDDIGNVCTLCFKDMELHSSTCDHKKTQCVFHGGQCHEVRLNPYEAGQSYYRRKHYRICINYPTCQYGNKCQFPHSEAEQLVWNSRGGQVSIIWKCFPCDFQRANELFTGKCLQSADHKGAAEQQLVCRTTRMDKLIAINPLPRNKEKMRKMNIRYAFKHSQANCQMPHGRCSFPHSHIEEEAWNVLLYGGTPQQKKYEEHVRDNEVSARVPVEVQHCSVYGQNTKLVPQEELCMEVLDGELSPDCYKDRFRTLLYLEEHERQNFLTKECNMEFKLQPSRGYFLLAPVAADQDNFCLIAELVSRWTKFAKITFAEGRVVSGAGIHTYRSLNGVVLRLTIDDAWSDELYRGQASVSVTVQFQLDRGYFERLHRTVEDLGVSAIRKIFPAKEVVYASQQRIAQHPRAPKKLRLDNEFQASAFEKLLKCSPTAPFVLTGPFGTGKTRLIARAAYQIASSFGDNTRVLISVHHRVTANSYVEEYFGPLSCTVKVKAVRFVPSRAQLPEVTSFTRQYVDSQTMRHKKETYQIIVCTNIAVSSLYYELGCRPGFFTHIFLDEAAQAFEPESMTPLLFADENTTVVLAGDHLQTGPKDEVYSTKAREKGLCLSLLQRIHTTYSNLDDSTRLKVDYMASLLANYRCHEAILRLPSNLFYDCCLLTRSRDSDPHPKAPYPLVFVCSSMDEAQTNRNAWDTGEAQKVLQYASHYLHTWPSTWGKFAESEVCILASSHQQQNVIREVMRSKYHGSKHMVADQVRVTFATQGLEFRVVFLSTSEPRIYQDGAFHNTSTQSVGGSVSNQRVFNTVLTRAKSLFVAVGNPFYLLDAEQSLVETEQQSVFCWKELLKTCISRGSIVFPDNCTTKQRQVLLQRVYLSRSMKSHVEDDTILQKNKEDFRNNMIELLTKHGMKLFKGKWIVVDKEVMEKSREKAATGKGTHVLDCKSFSDSLAIPLERNGIAYHIVGLKSRRGALDGASVVVEPISDDRPEDQSVAPLGRIVKVVQQQRDSVSDCTFLCRVDPYNSTFMIPLNGKDPKICNMPFPSRVFRGELNGGRTKEGPVVCFDKDSLLNDDNLCARDVIPFEDAKHMVFLVLFITWGEKYHYPLGAVIEAYPAGHSFFSAEMMLKAQHQIPDCPDGPSVECSNNEECVFPFPSVDFPAVFTIDQQSSVTLDDALSLQKVKPRKKAGSEGVKYEFAVHITSVAGQPDLEELLDIAAHNICTIYQKTAEGTNRYSMLPPRRAQKMSLDEGDRRLCISVIGQCFIKRNNNTYSVELENDINIKSTCVVSAAKLTFDAVEDVLNGLTPLKVKQYDRYCTWNRLHLQSLAYQIQLLYEISKELLQTRLKGPPQSLFFACQLPHDCEEHSQAFPRAAALVQEFMTWANWKVAQFLMEKDAVYVPLRCQKPPADSQMKEAEPNLVKALAPYRNSQHDDEQQGMTFSMALCKELVELCTSGIDTETSHKLRMLLWNQQNHPQLMGALGRLYSIQRPASYQLKREEDTLVDLRHFSLNCHYTHFTSPLRRCFDILVQMAILSATEGQRFLLERKALQKLIQDCNRKGRNARQFENTMKQTVYALNAVRSSRMCEAFVVDVIKTKLKLSFCNPEMNQFEATCSTLSLDALKYVTPKDQSANPPDALPVMWKYKECHFRSTLPAYDDSLIGPDTEPVSGDDQDIVCTYSKKHHRQDDVHGSPETLLTMERTYLEKKSYKVSVQPSAVTLSPSAWSALKNTYHDVFTQEEASRTSQDLQHLTAPDKVTKSSHSKATNSPVFQVVKTARFLGPTEPVKVWVGASVQNKLIAPMVQLLQPCQGLELCVQHGQRPAECFSDPRLKNASLELYEDINDYVEHWEPVLLAEAAYSAVKEIDLIFLKEVPLKFDSSSFKQLSQCALEEAHFAYHRDGEITLHVPESLVEDVWSYFQFNVGDFACVRYNVSRREKVNASDCADSDHDEHALRQVLHMVVKEVVDPRVQPSQTKGENSPQAGRVPEIVPKLVKFKFVGERNAMIPESLAVELQKGQCTCTMQLIPCPISHRRVYRSLTRLRQCKNALMSSIATSQFRRTDMEIQPVHGEGPDPLQQLDDAAVTHLWGDHGVKPDILNEEQMNALKMAIRRKFSLIQGPPGTGKSVTGAHLAYAFALKNRINPVVSEVRLPTGVPGEAYWWRKPVMYCGPSNKAVDRVLDILHKIVRSQHNSVEQRPLRILRLYSKSVERKTYVGPFADKNVFAVESTDHICRPEHKGYALHHIIRQQVDLDAGFSEMNATSKLPTSHDIIVYNKRVHNAELSALADRVGPDGLVKKGLTYDIVLCTCNEAASHRVSRTMRPAQCIIDEAAMATEPESMVPIALSDHVVLIGDDKQLQPVIEFRGAEDNGLIKSLFERYAEMIRDPGHDESVRRTEILSWMKRNCFVCLKTQYRMHETICQFPSEEFYEGKLITDGSVGEEYEKFLQKNPLLKSDFWKAGPHSPIMFCDVEGKESKGKKTDRNVALQSKSNELEAGCMVAIAEHLLVSRKLKGSVVILTPYRGQKQVVQDLVREKHAKLQEYVYPKEKAGGTLYIRTINECQGDEFDIVLLSTVRSLPRGEYHKSVADTRWLADNLGFITDPHRICVGLTRAKFGLIIFGNADFLALSQTWENLIEHYTEKNCLIEAKKWKFLQDAGVFPHGGRV